MTTTNMESGDANVRRRRFPRWILLVLLGLLGLCIIGCALLFAQLTQVLTTEAPALQAIIDRFMRYGANKDVEAAYELFAEEAREQVPPSDVQELIIDLPFLFENYESATLTGFNVTSNVAAGSRPYTYAEVAGTVKYGDGAGDFEATLLKIGSDWRLISIQIVVSPTKFKAWQDSQPR